MPLLHDLSCLTVLSPACMLPTGLGMPSLVWEVPCGEWSHDAQHWKLSPGVSVCPSLWHHTPWVTWGGAQGGVSPGILTPHAASAGLQATFDRDWQAGRITHDSYRNGSEDGALAYKLLIQTGNKKEPFNFNQVSSDRAGLAGLGMTLPQLLSSCPLLVSPTADHAAAGGRERHHPPRHLLHLPDGVGQQRPPGLCRFPGQLLPPTPRVDS